MQKLVFTIVLLMTATLISNAQVSEAWRVSYTTNIESHVRDFHLDNSGNSIAAGTVSWVDQKSNFVIVKFNQNGDTLWRREYHSFGQQHDHLFDTHVDGQGNIYACGLSTAYQMGEQTTLRTVKYSPAGNLLWEASDTVNGFMETPGVTKEAYIQEAPDGSIYVCTNKQRRLYMIKYTPSGNLVYHKLINVPPGDNGTNPRAFEVNSTGMYIFCMRLNTSFSFDILGVKCGFNGDTLWTWMETFQNNFWEIPRNMTIDAQGNCYFLTEIFLSFTASKVATTKISSGGGIWSKIYVSDDPADKMIPSDIEVDNNLNVVLTTSESYLNGSPQKFDAVTLKYSPQGDSIWCRRIRGFENNDVIPKNIIIDNNNFIYVAGQYPMSGSSSQYLQKYTPSGDSLWNFRIANQNYWTIGKFSKIDNAGNIILASDRQNGIMLTKFANATGIRVIENEIATGYKLSQNYPNPFNPKTNIRYELPASGFVRLAVYDISGKEIETLVSTKQNAGVYEIDWDGSKLSSGVYFYKLTTDNFVATKKMILNK